MEPQEQNINQAEPKKKMAISIPAAIITAGVIVALALVFSGKGISKPIVKQQPTTGTTPTNLEQPSTEIALRANDYIRGDVTKASVVIVEYSDSDCPYCQRFHATMKDVLKKYGTKVAWVYRYFPLDMHPNAHNEANALECVGELGGNEKFWAYLDQIMDITVAPDKSAPILLSTATDLGIDAKAFTSCVSSPVTAKKVADQSAEAQNAGGQGTPYSIAISKDGKQAVIAGAYPLEEVVKTIDSLMK